MLQCCWVRACARDYAPGFALLSIVTGKLLVNGAARSGAHSNYAKIRLGCLHLTTAWAVCLLQQRHTAMPKEIVMGACTRFSPTAGSTLMTGSPS